MIDLWQPTSTEVDALLGGSDRLRGAEIVDGALPDNVILDQCKRLAIHYRHRYKWTVPFMIYYPSEGKIVGSIGGKGLLADDDEIELGYNVAVAYRRRGIATEAIKLLTAEALADGLSPLAHVQPANEASARALARCGYCLEHRIALPDGIELHRYSLPD